VGEAILQEGHYANVRLWTPSNWYSRSLTWLESWGWSTFCYRWMEGHTYRANLATNLLPDLRHIMPNVGNSYMGAHHQLGLKGINWRQPGGDATKHTLKTWRILLRSNFQAAIVSLSFFACTSRETAFRPLRLMTFLWIPATVLRSRASSVNNPNGVSQVRPTSSTGLSPRTRTD